MIESLCELWRETPEQQSATSTTTCTDKRGGRYHTSRRKLEINHESYHKTLGTEHSTQRSYIRSGSFIDYWDQNEYLPRGCQGQGVDDDTNHGSSSAMHSRDVVTHRGSSAVNSGGGQKVFVRQLAENFIRGKNWTCILHAEEETEDRKSLKQLRESAIKVRKQWVLLFQYFWRVRYSWTWAQLIRYRPKTKHTHNVNIDTVTQENECNLQVCWWLIWIDGRQSSYSRDDWLSQLSGGSLREIGRIDRAFTHRGEIEKQN